MLKSTPNRNNTKHENTNSKMKFNYENNSKKEGFDKQRLPVLYGGRISLVTSPQEAGEAVEEKETELKLNLLALEPEF